MEIQPFVPQGEQKEQHQANKNVTDQKARSMTYPISLHTTAMKEVQKDVTKKIRPSDISNESEVKSEVHVIFATNASSFHIPKFTIGKEATIDEVTKMSKLIDCTLPNDGNLEEKRKKLRKNLSDAIHITPDDVDFDGILNKKKKFQSTFQINWTVRLLLFFISNFTSDRQEINIMNNGIANRILILRYLINSRHYLHLFHVLLLGLGLGLPKPFQWVRPT